MNDLASTGLIYPRETRSREKGQARTVILPLVAFVTGIALSAAWFSHSRVPPKSEEPAALSSSTEQVLQHLDSPIEVRFYSVLDPATVPEATKAYAERVAQLLARYQQESKGRIKVTRLDSQSSSNANAAVADGIKPFDSGKGDACYLGVAVLGNGQKETLASLSPEWEQALESDLTRAIGRTEANANVPAPAPTDPSIVESVKEKIPNLDSVSLEQGTQILRQAALAEFAQAAQDMEAKIKAAQDRLVQAQSSGSEADQQNALQELQQLQAEQPDKLKQIAANSKAQIQAFTQLKTGSH